MPLAPADAPSAAASSSHCKRLASDVVGSGSALQRPRLLELESDGGMVAKPVPGPVLSYELSASIGQLQDYGWASHFMSLPSDISSDILKAFREKFEELTSLLAPVRMHNFPQGFCYVASRDSGRVYSRIMCPIYRVPDVSLVGLHAAPLRPQPLWRFAAVARQAVSSNTASLRCATGTGTLIVLEACSTFPE